MLFRMHSISYWSWEHETAPRWEFLKKCEDVEKHYLLHACRAQTRSPSILIVIILHFLMSAGARKHPKIRNTRITCWKTMCLVNTSKHNPAVQEEIMCYRKAKLDFDYDDVCNVMSTGTWKHFKIRNASSTERRRQNAERRAQSAEDRAQKAEHVAQSAEHRVQRTEHMAQSVNGRAQSTEPSKNIAGYQ